MNALTLHQRPTDVPTEPPAASVSAPVAASMPAPAPEPGAITWATAAGTGIGAALKASGGGGQLIGLVVGLLLAAFVGTVLWMDARVSRIEEWRSDDMERQAAKDARDMERQAAEDARLLKIEMSQAAMTESTKEIPEIKRAIDRLVEDERQTAGALASIERILREEKPPTP